MEEDYKGAQCPSLLKRKSEVQEIKSYCSKEGRKVEAARNQIVVYVL